MNRLNRFHRDDPGDAQEARPATPDTPLVPPQLPTVKRYVAPAPDDRPFASTACPNCATPIKDLTPYSRECETCGQPIVVKSGEDGQWHLLREDDMAAFAEDQENILEHRYEGEEAALREAGFLIGDRSVDVVDEAEALPPGVAGGIPESAVQVVIVAVVSVVVALAPDAYFGEVYVPLRELRAFYEIHLLVPCVRVVG